MQVTQPDNYEDLFDFLSKVDQDMADINESLANMRNTPTRSFPEIPQLIFANLGAENDMLFIECVDEDYYSELRLRMGNQQSRTYELLGGTYSRVVLHCRKTKDHYRIGLTQTPFRARSSNRQTDPLLH